MLRGTRAMRKRQGFTLVEMMVSMALVIFIMVLLSQAFVASATAFRQLRGLGNMEEKLRTASSLLRRDLSATHFPGHSTQYVGKNGFFKKGPPEKGYFRIYHGSPIVRPSPSNPTPNNTYEETDGDLIPAARVTDHSLAMTVHLTGGNRQDYFTADITTDGPSSPLAGAGSAKNPYQISGPP